jgi:TatA/E family protein of Tat protein translocase
MGPVGWQEMAFIFVLALLLFGPKKLPELGRMLGKAMTEFRRAQSELKSTFEREMKNLERENESLKQITSTYQPDHYNYDYSSYDTGPYGDSYHSSPAQDSTVTNTPTNSASATSGADQVPAVLPAEGAIAHQTETAAAPVNGEVNGGASHENADLEHAASGSPAEHKA